MFCTRNYIAKCVYIYKTKFSIRIAVRRERNERVRTTGVELLEVFLGQIITNNNVLLLLAE
jgi:hypothetical protein